MGMRPAVVMAPIGRRRRRFSPLGLIPVLIAMGIVAYLITKNMG
jgi:hypothetical protein